MCLLKSINQVFIIFLPEDPGDLVEQVPFRHVPTNGLPLHIEEEIDIGLFSDHVAPFIHIIRVHQTRGDEMVAIHLNVPAVN